MIKRKAIEYIKNNTNKPLVGMEVGVYMGDHAINILQNLNIQKLYLVDPYVMYPDYNVLDLPTSLEDAKIAAFNITKDYNVEFIYKKFHEISSDFFGETYFDFIYIDGEHSEDAFILDIAKAFSLIKSTGILCGHDANFEGIRRQLFELKAKSFEVQIFENDNGGGFDWLINLSKK